MWPEAIADVDAGPGEQATRSTTEGLSLEAQIANEMSSLQRSRKEKRFGKYSPT
jgi:tRNA acetyltransferase TAN1